MKGLKAAVSGLALVSLLLVGAHTAAPAMNDVALNYFYAGAGQGSIPNSETGVSAFLDIEKPTLDTARGDFHTLGEITVKNAAGTQIIEAGWTVDPGACGDSHVHLFVFSWLNGSDAGGYGTGCAGGTGWVDNSANPINAGANLDAEVGVLHTFAIIHQSSTWSVQYDSALIGWWPDSRWSGATPPTTFTSFTEFQGFGEVAANSTNPCTDMGKGTLATGPTSPTGARVSSVTYQVNGSAGVSLTAFTPTNATYYNNVLLTSGRTVYFGGPGNTASPC